MNRNSPEAQDARVWLVEEAMRAQDNDEGDTEALAVLLLNPTDAEITDDESDD